MSTRAHTLTLADPSADLYPVLVSYSHPADEDDLNAKNTDQARLGLYSLSKDHSMIHNQLVCQDDRENALHKEVRKGLMLDWGVQK